MFLDLVKLDFAAAASHNLLVLCFLPIGIFLFLYKAIIYIKDGKTKIKLWETIIYAIMFLVCIVFAILRNLPDFKFLAP